MKMGIAIAQVADFQRVNVAAHLLFAQQQTRNRDERGGLSGNALRKIHLGNSPRRHQHAGKAIHDPHGSMAGRD